MQPSSQNNNVPSIKQPGNWSPLDNYTNDVQPPKQSFFSRYKKLIIVSIVALVLLIGLAILASLTDSKKGQNSNIAGSKTSVQMQSYDGRNFSMTYAKGLDILPINSANDDGNQLILSDGGDNPSYDISINISTDDPLYASSEDGLKSNLNGEDIPSNLQTSDVVMAGNSTQKTVGELTDNNGITYYFVYSGVNVGGKFVMLTAKYAKDNSLINDSFDAMLGSIKLK